MPVDFIVILIVILLIVLMWRGPKTLPKWGAALGTAVRGARTEASKAQAGIQKRLDEPDEDNRPPA
jgi:Sec-independent protein translocase protein TatA